MIRRLIPSGIKRNIRLIQRQLTDRKKGYNQQFAQIVAQPVRENRIVQLEQPIFYNPLSANKVENIQLAIDQFEQVEIAPGQIFSFWSILGKPTAEKGYKTGRNIIGNALQTDIGGGLCQVSGMLYHLALLSGMEIIERHNHTLDLYTEDKRYTPLGADATVVYGYKDLRFRNPKNTPVSFNFNVTSDQFTGALYSNETWPLYSIRFDRHDFPTYRTITTYRTDHIDNTTVVNESKYGLPKEH